MTSHHSPLMRGTRLFLDILVIALYFVVAVLAIVQGTLLFSALQPEPTRQFTATDSMMMASMFVFVLLTIAFFRVLRTIVRSVADGDPFNRANPGRMSRLAWLALGLWAVDLLFVAFQVPTLVETGSPDIVGKLAAQGFDRAISLIAPVTLFILARVFRHGVEMRDDLEGTV